MEELSKLILEKLRLQGKVTSEEIDAPLPLIHSALISLDSKGICTLSANESHEFALTEEGEQIKEKGSYEYILFNSIGSDGIELSELEKHRLGKVNAFRNKWIRKEGERVYRNVEDVEDVIRNMLTRIDTLSEGEMELLKKRKLVTRRRRIEYMATRGPMFLEYENLVTELSSKMVVDGSYKGLSFKPYNFESKGNIPLCGSMHPLMKMREEIKRVFVEMGFREMATNQYVESSFWNFDALFQPQNHPSRDAHDTFFLSNPSISTEFPRSYLELVAKTHEGGRYGSLGYSGTWELGEAQKNILRTHTTAISARNLYELAKRPFKPVKLFSIDKVFRNESTDATHLAEFHQVEGLIAGRGLTLGHLMGVLQEFFNKLGMGGIRFKPAHNPYTEPSMEVFGFHKGLNKWIEVGNSGVFRPEMLMPMGLDADVRVIAWGLSLERPAMIKYDLSNIRELVGHKVNLEFAKNSAFCYFN
jgi:phenylalanyl-tRNA synthetase alpha chain